jgi:hypothetical protein
MGIHYANGARLGITQTEPLVSGNDGVVDPEKPEIMIYEPQADGGMKLVAVEYLVFEAAWKAAGNTNPPTLFGQEFVYMKDNPATSPHEAHGFEPHYELHVWLYRDNPAGMFAEFNPSVACLPGAARTDLDRATQQGPPASGGPFFLLWFARIAIIMTDKDCRFPPPPPRSHARDPVHVHDQGVARRGSAA